MTFGLAIVFKSAEAGIKNQSPERNFFSRRGWLNRRLVRVLELNDVQIAEQSDGQAGQGQQHGGQGQCRESRIGRSQRCRGRCGGAGSWCRSRSR